MGRRFQWRLTDFFSGPCRQDGQIQNVRMSLAEKARVGAHGPGRRCCGKRHSSYDGGEDIGRIYFSTEATQGFEQPRTMNHDSQTGSHPPVAMDDPPVVLPERIGRYRVEKFDIDARIR